MNRISSHVQHVLSVRNYSTTAESIWNKSCVHKVTIKHDDRDLNISHGKFARFADGCAVAQLGETSVMVTAVGKQRSTPAPFLPLTVDYRQKAAAAGRIPTSHVRRELGPSEIEILTGRVIDRSIRPLFPNGINCDIQLLCNLLAVDGLNDPDIAAINAASAALAVSDIPWDGPVGAVRVGWVGDKPVINPSRKELRKSLLNLIVSGVKDRKIVMLEGSAENLPRDCLKQAISVGVKNIYRIIHGIEDLRKKCGKPKRILEPLPELDREIKEAIEQLATLHLRKIFTDFTHHKISRDMAVQDVRKTVLSYIKGNYPDANQELISDCFNATCRDVFRNLIFETNLRCDGRQLQHVRPISCEVDLFSPLHGSALFQRGQTQVLCTATFDSPDSAAKLDTMSSIVGGIKEKNFFLHYEFPPYATNETGRPGMVGRRERGHGALAEKSLRPVIPSDFPFTIRLTAEVLESNGSSSMASSCAGSLALMDAGVPISEPVAGVAIGLVTQLNDEGGIEDHRMLTDLLGIEDYMGDMDFKIAGTKTGVTAIQADIKLTGLPVNIAADAIDRSRDAHKHILDIMEKTQRQTRAERKENHPVIEKLDIPANKRSKFVGSGGHNLRKLMADTGVSINQDGDGTFQVFAPNKQSLEEAKEKIEELLAEEVAPQLEFGGIYNSKIVEIRDYGIMVELYVGMKPALVYNSQLDNRKIYHPSVLNLKVGDEIMLKHFGHDPVSGAMRLSRRVLLPNASHKVDFISDTKNINNKDIKDVQSGNKHSPAINGS